MKNPQILTLLQFKELIATYPGASGPAFVHFENEILHGNIKVPGERISCGDIRKWCQEILPKIDPNKEKPDTLSKEPEPYFKKEYPEIKPLPTSDMCRQCARVVTELIGDLKLCSECYNL